MSNDNDVLLLTAAVNVSGVPYVNKADPQERLFQYLCSLIAWIKYGSISTIVFCENTNCDYDFSRILALANEYNKNLEILVFSGNKKSLLYGKAWGEGELLEYAFANSKNMTDERNFYKLTGQIFIKNNSEFFEAHRDIRVVFVESKINKKYSDRLFDYPENYDFLKYLEITRWSLRQYLFYLSRGLWFGRPNVDYRLFTVIYKCNVGFFKENLLSSYKTSNERRGYVIEKVYADRLKGKDYQKQFLVGPQLVGRGGSSGQLYAGLDYDSEIKAVAKSLIPNFQVSFD